MVRERARLIRSLTRGLPIWIVLVLPNHSIVAPTMAESPWREEFARKNAMLLRNRLL